MRPVRHAFRTRVRAQLLLLSAFLVHASQVQGQAPPPPLADLAPEARTRLVEAAQDPKLELWQRELMLGVAHRGNSGGATSMPSAISGGTTAPTEIASIDGDWKHLPPPALRAYHTEIYDPVRNRVVVFGGLSGRSDLDDVWVLTLAGGPTWSELATAGTPPAPRYGHTAIYDPVRDRMVVFGGYDVDSDTVSNEVWALSFAGSAAWSQLAPAGTPPAKRYIHSAIYDPVRDRMVVFGGRSLGTFYGDTWSLSLAGGTAWSELPPSGTPPGALAYHTATYDPVRDRMVVLGGHDGINGDDKLWGLSLTGSPVWSELATAGTSPGFPYQHTAIYDPTGDRMLVFAGVTGSAPHAPSNGVWSLSLAGTPTWNALVPTGSPPHTRVAHQAIYDAVHHSMVVFGGEDGFQSDRNDLWELSLQGNPAWTELAPSGNPLARIGHSAIYDPARDRMIVYGGRGVSGSSFNEVWSFSLTGAPLWTQIIPAGTPPIARYGHTAIYDPVRDRMVVFAGNGLGIRNDVWGLSLGATPTWSQLLPSGTPPHTRYLHSAVYDPAHDRMVVYGGLDFSAPFRGDVWALSFAGSPAWSALAPSGTPPDPRSSHTAIYDPPRNRMLVFGGDTDILARNDLWALSLSGSPAWTALAPSGSPPSVRSSHTAIYDPQRDRMVVFGGDEGGGGNDAWALSLAGVPAWTALGPTGSPPAARSSHTAIYDPIHDHMIVFAGSLFDGGMAADTWALAWSSGLAVPGDVVSRRFAFALPRPNPSRGETTLDFELAQPARVVLEAFDAQGRRVKRIADAWFRAGRHVSIWRGDAEDGRPLAAGLYFVRMRSDGFGVTRRAMRIR